MTGCLQDIETFSRLDRALVYLLLAPAKDPATAAKNVRCKTSARDWITQGQSAEHRANHVALALDVIQKNSVAEVDKGVLAGLWSIDCPAFIGEANLTTKK